MNYEKLNQDGLTTDEKIAAAQSAAIEVINAFLKARAKHSPMRGPHEGYAILLEEVDELWEEVRKWQPDDYNKVALRKEAMHVAAMALAFIVEVCDGA